MGVGDLAKAMNIIFGLFVLSFVVAAVAAVFSPSHPIAEGNVAKIDFVGYGGGLLSKGGVKVIVTLDDGTIVTFPSVSHVDGIKIGDRVRIEENIFGSKKIVKVDEQAK